MPALDPFDLLLLLGGLLCAGAAVVPRLLRRNLVTFPMVVVAAGALMGLLPHPFTEIDPIRHGEVAERLTEFTVIIALTSLGLRIDRPISWHGWASTWRLLAVTMPLTIAASAVFGWWLLGLAPATAVLLGACLAPTDPVLSTAVQTGPPSIGDPAAREPDEVRFALTSESALNDGLAFPFTHLAIAVAVAGGALGSAWVDLVLVDVVYRVAAAVLAGWVLGRVLGAVLMRMSRGSGSSRGLLALALTLIGYAATEVVGGYGFVGVFVTAYTVRNIERTHRIHDHLHEGTDQFERLAVGVVLFLFGAALTGGGMLAATTPMTLLAAAVLVLVVRPVTAALGLLGSGDARRDEKVIVGLFGIRGVGSFYYLAYALGEARFPQADLLWALVSWTVLLSLVFHGATAPAAMRWLDRRRPAADQQPAS